MSIDRGPAHVLDRAGLLLMVVFLTGSFSHLFAQEKEDLDAHSVSLDAFWFYSQPSGSFHLNLQGGYQLSSRLSIKSKDNRIGLDLTQRGAVAGLEFSF